MSYAASKGLRLGCVCIGTSSAGGKGGSVLHSITD